MRMYNMNYTAAYAISRHLIYKMFASGVFATFFVLITQKRHLMGLSGRGIFGVKSGVYNWNFLMYTHNASPYRVLPCCVIGIYVHVTNKEKLSGRRNLVRGYHSESVQ